MIYEPNSYYSAYYYLRNKSIQWLPSDSEDCYQQHLKKKNTRNNLQRFGWLNTTIEYKFNNYGFRSDEFIFGKENIVFLGCSYTVGIGIPFEKTFAKTVANELGLACYNLSVGGGSLDSCFRFASYWLEKLKPTITVLIEPSKNRKEIFVGKEVFHNLAPGYDYDFKSFYKDWILNEINSNLLKEKNIIGIQHFCNKINTKLFVFDNEFDYVDHARDLSHPGVISNKHKHTQILNKIKN